jgi:phosphohistidine phosphatase
MKTLYLVRHAEAETKQKQPDYKRALTDSGVKEAELMGKKMLKAGMEPEHIISSHATRAFETAKILAKELRFPEKNIEIQRDIFENDPGMLLDVVTHIEERFNSAMLVGHNPSVTQFAMSLYPAFTSSMHTCGLVILRSHSNSWAEFSHADIEFVLYDYPKKA